VACYDRHSEWCTRAHHTCHPTVPLPALSHIPSPLLHTSPSHHDCRAAARLLLADIGCSCSEYLLLQNALLLPPHTLPLPKHSSTSPTHLHSLPHTTLLHTHLHPLTTTAGQLTDSFWPTFVAIAANTFLSRMNFLSLKALAPSMNNTLATNSYSRKQLSEPWTEDPLSSSFSSNPASCSSNPVISASSLFISSSAHCSTSPSYAHREQNLVSLILHTRARLCCPCRPMQEIQVQRSFPYVHSRLPLGLPLPLGMFSHFAPWNKSPRVAFVVPGRDRFANFARDTSTTAFPLRALQVAFGTSVAFGNVSHFAP